VSGLKGKEMAKSNAVEITCPKGFHLVDFKCVKDGEGEE